MSYILNEKIIIKKPIIFLCGPFYQENNSSDRRKILKDYFLNNYRDKCLPLIIDDFLTKKNIADETISIQLLEEIFAGISCRTYVFLDTMSSAVELGLFSNSAFNNSLYVMLPQEKDIFTTGVGYFIKEIVLKENTNKIKTTWYRPKIDRIALSSDYVTEHFSFVDDKVPTHIKEEIQDDLDENLIHEREILIHEIDAYPRNDFCINYKYNSINNLLKLFVSVQLLFYIVGGVLYAEYSDKLRKKEDLDFDHYNVEWAVNNLKATLLEYMQKHTFIGINSKTNIEIVTVLVKDLDEIVKHIVTFIFTYHRNGRLNGYFIIEKNDIVKPFTSKANPIDVFHLSSDDVSVINAIKKDCMKFFKKFIIKSGTKKREIVTYIDNENGNVARKIHEKIVNELERTYLYDKHSFAYQKGKSVKQCAELHKDSIFFLKYDIHKFFNCIDKKVLIEILLDEFCLDLSYKYNLYLIFGICFVDDRMPLGLISSPILSDIYLKSFDRAVTLEIEKYGFIYTRYADDILISSMNEISEPQVEKIDSLIEKELKIKKLILNTKKCKKINLKFEGQHIKYLGMNIVRKTSGNIITVGKEYKNYIAKCYLKYLDMKDDTESKFYFGKQIAGYLGFIKMIEGEKGLNQIYNRIEKNTDGRVIVKDGIINL